MRVESCQPAIKYSSHQACDHFLDRHISATVPLLQFYPPCVFLHRMLFIYLFIYYDRYVFVVHLTHFKMSLALFSVPPIKAFLNVSESTRIGKQHTAFGTSCLIVLHLKCISMGY